MPALIQALLDTVLEYIKICAFKDTDIVQSGEKRIKKSDRSVECCQVRGKTNGLRITRIMSKSLNF